MKKKPVFCNFNEFWSLTRRLTHNQRNTIFSGLSSVEKRKLENSYKKGGWEDCFLRNRIDNVLDGIKKDFGIDMLRIKAKIVKGKCSYVKKDEWEWVSTLLGKYPKKHTNYILSGICIENEDDKMVCLVPDKLHKN